MNPANAPYDTTRMCKSLGIPEAPLVVAGVTEMIAFFRNVLKVDPFAWIAYIRGIDFHKPVCIETLRPGNRLSRHKSTGPARGKPFVYFTKPGTSQFSTGTSFPQSDYELFELPSQMTSLVSTASGIKFGSNDHVSRLGGGQQYILSLADSQLLRLIQG